MQKSFRILFFFFFLAGTKSVDNNESELEDFLEINVSDEEIFEEDETKPPPDPPKPNQTDHDVSTRTQHWKLNTVDIASRPAGAALSHVPFLPAPASEEVKRGIRIAGLCCSCF